MVKVRKFASWSRMRFIFVACLMCAGLVAVALQHRNADKPSAIADCYPAIQFWTLPPEMKDEVLKKYNLSSTEEDFVLSYVYYGPHSLVTERLMFSKDERWPAQVRISREGLQALKRTGLNYYVTERDPIPPKLIVYAADADGIDMVEIRDSLRRAVVNETKGNEAWDQFHADCDLLGGIYPK